MNSIDTTTMPHDNEIVQEEILATDYTRDLFDDEGPFGEADCAGL